jgi:hypothetical protein
MLHRAVFQRLFFMSSDVIISVEGLGKKHRIRHQAEGRRYVALRDVIAEKAKGFFKKMKSGNSENLKSGKNVSVSGSADVSVSAFQHVSISSSEDFWALKDVSFSVRQCMSVLPEPTGNTTG